MTLSQDTREGAESHKKSIHEYRQRAQRAHQLSSLLLPLLIASVGACGLTYSLYHHKQVVSATTESHPTSLKERIQPLLKVVDKVTGNFVGSEQSIKKEQAEAALLELRRLSFFVELQSADQIFEQLKQTVKSWNAQKQQTLTSDAGRRIASQEDAVARFLAIGRIGDSVAESVSRFGDTLELLKQTPPSEVEPLQINQSLSKVRDLTLLMKEAASSCVTCTAMLTSLLNQNTNEKGASNTLAEVLAVREGAFDDLLSSTRRKQEQATTALLQKELESIRGSSETLTATVADLEGKVAAAKSGQVSAAHSSPARSTVSLASYQRELEVIRSLLKPFISPGYAQPASRDEFKYLTTKSPMSLTMIADAGGLDDSSTGLETLFRIGGSKSTSQHNDRPLGNFPRMNSAAELALPDVASRLRQAQRLLRDYGPMLVKDRLLKP